MFAFVIYDSVNRRLFGARDRLGVKPLYYARSDRRFAFGSEPKALLALPDVSRAPRLAELPNYLTFNCVPGSGTLFRDIEKLEPGTMFQVGSDGQCHHEQYWVPRVPEPGLADSAESLEDDLWRHLQAAVAKRVPRDVRCGVLLSGGVDSSVVVGLMSETSGPPVKTFTAGYPGDEGNVESDLHWARLVARRFRTDHHEEIITDAAIAHALDDVAAFADEPIGAPSVVANMLLARCARQSGVTVVQVGEGADELFCGYPATHRLWRLHERVHVAAGGFPRSAARLAARAVGPFLERLGNPSPVGLMDGSIAEYLGRFGRGEHVYWGYGVQSTTRDHERLFAERSAPSNRYECIRRAIRKVPGFSSRSYLDQLALIDLLVGLPERLLMRVDKATMRSGVEAREPFLDPAVVGMALKIPPTRRAKFPKSVLKDTAGRLLPSEVLRRPKVGFPTAHRTFLAPALLALVRESVIHKRFLELTGLDRSRLEMFLGSAEQGHSRFFYQVWSVFVLSLWFHHWVETDR
jgi:asparagine synthase (glutamine-hydrolysing)